MKTNYLTLLLILFLSSNSYGQDFSLYKKQVFISDGDTLNYRILKPLNYDPNYQYPVHLFLHGAGKRGNDNISQLTHGGKLFLKNKIERIIILGVFFLSAQKMTDAEFKSRHLEQEF